MSESETISKLQNVVDILSDKFKCSFSGTFKASNPVYNLPKPLTLPSNRKYEAALLYFAGDNYLPNVDNTNNRFTYSSDRGTTWKTITIAEGAYELADIITEIKQKMINAGDNADAINITASLNTFLSTIEITDEKYQIDFNPDNSLRHLLGFNPTILAKKARYESPKTVQITTAKAINIHCSLVCQSYDSNGLESDIIYSFPAYKVEIGYKINEEPNTPRFLPVEQTVIKNIRFKITDNTGHELTFKDEECAFSIYLQQV